MTARRRHAIAALAALLGLAVLAPLDGPLYHAIGPTLDSRRALEEQDWYWLLRITGTYWTWLVIAAAFICLDALPRGPRPSRPAWARGALVALAAAAAGIAAELLKLVIARERPATIVDGALRYQGNVFRGPFAGFLDGSNLGFPSSHAATAFGGAFALAMLVPPLAPLALALAAGCAITRMLTGAHFATDVFGGMVLGYAAARAAARALPSRSAGIAD